MRPVCSLCGSKHFQREPHVFASNSASNKVVTASNKASNAVPVASNAIEQKIAYRDELREQLSGVTDLMLGASNKKQRWAKDKYNDYMKMYMKVLRAVKAGKAEKWVPSS